MKPLALFLICLSFGCETSFAQLNESDTALFQVRVSLTGNVQTGNVNLTTVRGRADFSVAPSGAWAFKTQNSLLCQNIAKRRADKDLFSRNFVYLHPQRQVYPFVIGWLSTNYRRKIGFRYFAGAGATWQAINHPKHVLKLSLAGVYEDTKFNAAAYNDTRYDGRARLNTWRGAARIFGKHDVGLSKTPVLMRLYYDAFLQPSLQYRNNLRWQAELGAEIPVWRGLALNVVYIATHESIVAAGVLEDDRILTFGLSYNLKMPH